MSNKTLGPQNDVHTNCDNQRHTTAFITMHHLLTRLIMYSFTKM